MARQRPLTNIEIRVLGCLLEKEQTTPDLYPLTINAVLAAANQKSNREPVLDLTETEVVNALDALRLEGLAWKSEGARSERWSHLVDRRWKLDKPTQAVMTLLLLRGPQTPGELRTRSERLHAFAAVEDVERLLNRLAAADEPLVVELPRQPGKREIRFGYTVGAEPHPMPVTATHVSPLPAGLPLAPGLSERVAELERTVEELGRELAALKEALGV